MTKEEAEAKIKAAAWAVAASNQGWREAVRLLRMLADEITTAQWRDRR